MKMVKVKGRFRGGESPRIRELAFILNRIRRSPLSIAGIIIVLFFTFIAIFAPVLAHPQPNRDPYMMPRYGFSPIPRPPGPDFLFGTTEGQYDLYYGIIWGARTAYRIGVLVVAVSMIMGIVIGSIAGYYKGVIDEVLMRITDIILAFPALILAMAFVVAFGRGLDSITFALILVWWPSYARLVRGEVLKITTEDFVEAAKAAGASTFYIIRKHILPNMIGPILVNLAFGVPGAMMTESGLAVIGMGVRPPMPSWGNLIGEGIGMMMAFPHLLIFPAVTFAFTLISFTFLADGLRDAFNPRSEIS